FAVGVFVSRGAKRKALFQFPQRVLNPFARRLLGLPVVHMDHDVGCAKLVGLPEILTILLVKGANSLLGGWSSAGDQLRRDSLHPHAQRNLLAEVGVVVRRPASS